MTATAAERMVFDMHDLLLKLLIDYSRNYYGPG